MMKDEKKKNIFTKEDLFMMIDAKLSMEEKRELMKADPANCTSILARGYATSSSIPAITR